LAAAVPHTVVGVTPPNILHAPKKISFWGNNQYGDCVSAEEAFAKACHNKEIFITDRVVEDWAKAHNFLNGAMLSDVLNTMETNGFKEGKHTYTNGAYSSVDWTNGALLRNAISIGPVKIGVAANQLDTAYTYAKNGWVATGFQPDAQEDHCVSLCGFGTLSWLAQQLNATLPAGVDGTKQGYAMFTWDSIGIIDEPSMINITHEAWLRNPTTIIK